MADHIGEDNMYIFGLKAEHVDAWRRSGYEPGRVAQQSRDITRVLDAMAAGRFGRGQGQFDSIVHALRTWDTYFVLADFEAYAATQSRISGDFRQVQAWQGKCLLNIARMGFFSSDRTIREYASDVWQLPIPVDGRRTF
jgi:starch phosphorylase